MSLFFSDFRYAHPGVFSQDPLAGYGPIGWLNLSPVRSRQRNVGRCRLSPGSSGRCRLLGCTADCKHLWVCAGTLRGQACGSAGPWLLRQPWTTSSFFLQGGHRKGTESATCQFMDCATWKLEVCSGSPWQFSAFSNRSLRGSHFDYTAISAS